MSKDFDKMKTGEKLLSKALRFGTRITMRAKLKKLKFISIVAQQDNELLNYLLIAYIVSGLSSF